MQDTNGNVHDNAFIVNVAYLHLQCIGKTHSRAVVLYRRFILRTNHGLPFFKRQVAYSFASAGTQHSHHRITWRKTGGLLFGHTPIKKTIHTCTHEIATANSHILLHKCSLSRLSRETMIDHLLGRPSTAYKRTQVGAHLSLRCIVCTACVLTLYRFLGPSRESRP